MTKSFGFQKFSDHPLIKNLLDGRVSLLNILPMGVFSLLIWLLELFSSE